MTIPFPSTQLPIQSYWKLFEPIGIIIAGIIVGIILIAFVVALFVECVKCCCFARYDTIEVDNIPEDNENDYKQLLDKLTVNYYSDYDVITRSECKSPVLTNDEENIQCVIESYRVYQKQICSKLSSSQQTLRQTLEYIRSCLESGDVKLLVSRCKDHPLRVHWPTNFDMNQPGFRLSPVRKALIKEPDILKSCLRDYEIVGIGYQENIVLIHRIA